MYGSLDDIAKLWQTDRRFAPAMERARAGSHIPNYGDVILATEGQSGMHTVRLGVMTRWIPIILLACAMVSGCFARVTVTNPRGQTTHDLAVGQGIDVEFKNGRRISTRFRAFSDGRLVTDDGTFPLNDVRTLSYWRDDEMKPVPLVCCVF